MEILCALLSDSDLEDPPTKSLGCIGAVNLSPLGSHIKWFQPRKVKNASKAWEAPPELYSEYFSRDTITRIKSRPPKDHLDTRHR